MNTFVIDKKRLNEDDVARIASDCLGQKIEVISKINGGANNKVYHLACGPRHLVAKFYFRHALDSRDRLGVEFKSFSYLWGQGLRLIPQPMAFSQEHQCAFYGFVEGAPLDEGISRADIDKVADFLEVLKSPHIQDGALDLPPASEAFFCVKDVVESIQSRFDRIDKRAGSGREYDQLYSYLHKEFMPLFKAVAVWSRSHLEKNGIAYGALLPQKWRTLSPSDLGFHNALRTSDGKMIFLDFEYFGWDDPAKLVADFVWHPAMDISQDLKAYFVRRMDRILRKDPDFKVRLESVFPLFGLKWCLIFLNEFIPTELQRRDFASSLTMDKAEVRLGQLKKAKCMSDKIKATYKDFPYGS